MGKGAISTITALATITTLAIAATLGYRYAAATHTAAAAAEWKEQTEKLTAAAQQLASEYEQQRTSRAAFTEQLRQANRAAPAPADCRGIGADRLRLMQQAAAGHTAPGQPDSPVPGSDAPDN